MKRVGKEEEEKHDEERIPGKRVKEQRDRVPPLHKEYFYDRESNLHLDDLEQISVFFNHLDELIKKVDLMNEYAAIYCSFPTEENKVNVKAHLIGFAKACFHFSQYDNLETKTFMRQNLSELRIINRKRAGEIAQLFSQVDQWNTNFENLTRIATGCLELIRLLYYVEQKDNPPYPPAPPPIQGFPLAPVEGYYTHLTSLEVVEMLRLFTSEAMPTANLQGYFEGNEFLIIEALERIRRRNPDNVFEFNVDPVLLREELRAIPHKHGEVMYIIHAFQMFIVYGNFIVDDSDPRLVKGLHWDKINRSEMASTAYLFIGMHGNLTIKHESLPSSDLTDKMERAKKDVEEATKIAPEGMRLFIQKQADPLQSTFFTAYLNTYRPGTMSGEIGICNMNCKRKDSQCSCSDFVYSPTSISAVSSVLRDELRSGVLPSIAYIQEKFNLDKEEICRREGKNYTANSFIYKPGNDLVLDRLKSIRGEIPRMTEFIGRIPFSTTKYIDKNFEADASLALYGIYNLLTGRLISSTNQFLVEVIERRELEGERINTSIGVLKKIRRNDSEPEDIFPKSPMYVKKCKLSDIVDYFKNLGYRNVYLLDNSCEGETYYDHPSPIGYTLEEIGLRSTKIGKSGLGISRRVRRRPTLTTRKPSKRRGRRTRRRR
jgi:hypothetical protein